MVYVGKLVKYMWNVEHREKNICQSQVKEKIIDGNPVELQELLIIKRAGLEIAQRIYARAKLRTEKNPQESCGMIGHFWYIKIQLDSEAQRTQTKEMNKHGQFLLSVSSKPHCQAEFKYIENDPLPYVIMHLCKRF